MSERGPTLLLVDDEARILSALQRALRREGYTIATAENAEAALLVLDSQAVDLIVSDYKMPGRSGTELLALVRRRWPDIRRILLSGWSREIPKAELAAAAPHGVYAKPWDDGELKAAIASAIRIRH